MVRRPLSHRDDALPPEGSGAVRRARDAEAGTRDERSAGAARSVRRFLVILALLGSIQAIVMLGVEAHRAVEGQRAIARLQSDIAAIEAEAASLQAIVEHADDPVFREQLARRRGFVYPDEIRVIPLR